MTDGSEEVPAFSMVHLVESGPIGDGPRLTLEVPRSAVGNTYRALESLEKIQVGSRRFLKFGCIGAFGSALFDPKSGEVFETGRDADKVSLINSSLDKFSACVKCFIDGFPFYESGEDEEENEDAAQKIEDSIREIDPDAYYEGGFWYEVRWDVAIGDFATDDF